MNLYEEIELQEMQRVVDSLATENQMLQEPKTPTKEQIDIVANKIALYKHMPHPRVVAKIAITEWEKIRGLDK